MPRFTYLINNTKEVFENYDSLIARLKEADEMGWSVKELTEGEDEEVEDSTDVSRAPAEESMIEKIDSPNFGEDLATSASEGSDVFAQPELESSLEDTSLDLPAVTIDDIESEAEKNEVINSEALQGLLGGDEDRLKEAMQAIAKTPNMSGDSKSSRRGDVTNFTLSYTNPDTGKVDETFDLRIEGKDLDKKEVSKRAEELRKFLNRYADSNALTAIGDQAGTMLGSADLNPTQQEITASLPSRELMFEPQTKARFNTNTKYSGTGEIEEFDVYPYDAELEAKRNQLISEGSSLGVDELIAKSKDMVYAGLKEAKRQELLTQKTEQYLSENIDKRGIATLGGAVSKTKKFKAWTAKEAAVVTNTANSVAKTKNLVLASQYAEGTVSAAELKINGKIVMLGDLSDGSPILTYETGAQITQQQKDILDAEQVELNASLEAFGPLMQNLNETGKKLGDMDTQLKAAGLNFSILDKSASTLVTGLGSIGVSLGMFGIKTVNLLNYGSEALTGQVGAKTRFLRTDEALDEWGSEYSEFKEDIRSQYVRDLSVGEGFSSGKNFAKFVAQEISTQAPVLIAMAASGGTLAPYIVGAWTAGEKMMDIAYENSLMTDGNKTGAFESYAKAIGVGLANGVFTGLTTNPILQNGMKMFKGNTRKEFLLNLNDYWKLNWKRNLVYDNALELSGELATNVVENAIDGRPIFENADHVAVSSMGFSFAFSGLPFLKGAGMRALSPRKTTRDLDIRQKKIFDLEAAYAAIDKRTVAGKEIRTQLEALKVMQGREIAKAEQKAQNGISILGAQGVDATTRTINEAKEKASNIVNDPTLSYKQKEAALEKIQNDFMIAKSTQEAYLSSAFRDEFILLEATDPDGYQGYMDQAMNELNAYVVTDQVKQKASDLYNAKIIRDKFEKNKKVNSRARLFETTAEAVAEIEKMAEAGKITPKQKAEIIGNLKQGAGGVNIPTGNTSKDGKFTFALDADGQTITTPIAIIENQLSEQKIGVMEHEISHSVMDKLFANAPEKLVSMAGQIQLWMGKNQAALDLKIQLQLTPYMADYAKRIDKATTKEEKLDLQKELQGIIANEYMANFFELVGGGKGMDPLAPGNQAFMGLSGYMLQDLAGKDYNFDFKGPDDFIAFAASIAKGIKEGTVNINRLSDLQKQVDKIKADSKPDGAAKPTTKLSLPLQDKFDEAEDTLNDAEDMFNLDPNDPSLKKAVDAAQKAYDIAEAALDAGPVAAAEAAGEIAQGTEPVKKEKIVRPKADKSKRKYSLDKEVKKEIEPKIAEVQAINKVIKAEEKKLNAEAKQAIEDQPEVGDVTRTSKEKQLVELKENPVTINSKNSPDTTKQAAKRDKLQNEIVKALEVPISKAANLFTNVFYNKISSNAKQAVSRDEYLASAKANLTVMTINEFKPETINRKGENVINDIEDIIFQRGGLRAVKFAEDLGVVGKDQGTSRGAEALVKMASGDIEFEFDTKDSKKPEKKLVSGFKGEVRRPSALLANEKLTKEAKEKIIKFWEKNRGNKKVESFKNLPVVIDSLLAEIYGVSENTLTARSGNFNKETYKSAITAFTEKQAVFRTELNGEMAEVRVPYDQRDSKLAELETKAKEDSNFTFEEYAPESRGEGILRFLPELSVPEYKYFSGKRGRSAGKSTGMPRNFTDLAYLVTGRRTQAQGNREGEIQKISMDELLEAIGAIDDGNGNAVPDVAKAREAGKAINKMPGAQTLLSLIKLEGRMIANEMSREFGNLDPMTMLDMKMGKNPNMYSRALTKSFAIPGNNELVKGLNEKLETRFGLNWQDREVASLADVVDFIYRDLRKINLNTARTFTYEYVEQLRRSDEVAKGELAEAVGRAVGNAYGTAYKNILEKVGMNKVWNSLSKESLKKLSDEAKIKKIESFLKVYGRTFTNEKFLNMTNNADLFNELAKATGLGKKGLNKLGFALSAEPGINPRTEKEQTNIFIKLNKKPIKKVTGTDYIKKQIATGNTNKVNAAGVTLEKDAKDAHELILSEIKPLIKSGDLAGASEKLAIMRLGTNALVRKVSLLGKFIRLSPKDTRFILEHETAAVFIYDAYQQYINDKGTTTAKNKLEKFLKGAYVNVISKDLDAALPKVGGVERMNTKKVKKLINKKGTFVIDYAAQRKKLAKQNSKSLPLNLRQEGISLSKSIKQVENFNKAITLGNSLDQPTKGISVWDFDDTLATTKSSVLYTMPDGTTGKINAAEFAKKGDAMLAQGAKFDFSEFSKVVKGAKGPFFEKAMARNKKFGNENVYILTARPANSALAIHEFLKGIGLDIPLANITGLANSDPQAKANWVVEKFAEGYNDFYFADDHIGNVNAVKDVLSVLDVKSKVQQARVRYSLPLSKRFNEIIEDKTGIESFKEYQSVKSGKKGNKKGKFSFFIPPSAEDFMGLLYKTLPKGKKGESAMAFYKEHLIDPYWKGVSALRTQRIAIGKEYKALKKELGIVPRKLKKTFEYEDENGNMKESLFTKEDAIRVYVWDSQGLDIEGLSNVDLPILVNYINANPDLKAFADKLMELNKNNEPKAPTEGWPSGTITSDLLNTLNTEGRKQMLEVWQQNADAIFTKTNFNKLEAAFGARYVEALKSSLDAMSTGKNSNPTGHRVTDGFVRWLNAAVGNIMFLNRRSAVLQLISFTNFINFEGNNLYQAGKAFANQPQYWKDWAALMNSDYLVDRRDGLKINVNEADLATTAKESGFQGVLAKILQVGFTPTKYADSVAIATGGASFYRNKVNALLKEQVVDEELTKKNRKITYVNRYTVKQAEAKAMQEFIQIAETSQQSSDAAMTSKQQREPVGRIILAFANTPSQYARIIKKATQDLVAGRGNPRTHLSRIVYYGGIQNVVFNFLQQAMFAAMMGDDDEEEDEELAAAKEASMTKKSLKVANSMSDGILRGLGIGGAVVSVVKNLAIKIYEKSKKTRNQNYAETIKDEVMKMSPPISSKLSKMGKVGNAFEWGKKEIEFDEMSLKHPYVTAATNAVAAVTGLPLDRAQSMAIDAADIASSETETWMKPLIALGWPKWQLMSEEDTKKEKEDKKERFKNLEERRDFDKLNTAEKRRKILSDLSKEEQVALLRKGGLTRKQVSRITREAERVDKIMDMQNKEQFDKDMEAISQGKDIEEIKIERPKKEENKYSKETQKRMKRLNDMVEAEQVDLLRDLGLTRKQVGRLKSEKSRVLKIIELQNKKRKYSLK